MRDNHFEQDDCSSDGGVVLLTLHCEIHVRGVKTYEAVCLENSVVALGSSPKEAQRRLKKAMSEYFQDVTEDINRRIGEGLVPATNEAVLTEVQQYMQKVRLYRLRLCRWQFHKFFADRRHKNDSSFSDTGRVPYCARMA